MNYLAVVRALASLSVLGTLTLASVSGCAQGVAAPRTVVAKAQLVPWDGRYTELFDDRIDRLSLDTGKPTAPSSDELLKHRAQVADYIVRVRVLNVTNDQAADEARQHLMVEALGEPVAGRAPAQRVFDLMVAESNPFFAVVDRVGPKLSGREFVAYIKEFAGSMGPELHWFMSAESPEVVAAIRDAHLLMEVRASNP